jgi:L-ribulose-5-phosphate 3-epimerase
MSKQNDVSDLTRRGFLAAGLTTTISITLGNGSARGQAQSPASTTPPSTKPSPASSAPASTHPQRTLRKAVMIRMVSDGQSIVDKFTILRDAGIEGVEIDCPHDIDIREILKARDFTGVMVHGVRDADAEQSPLSDREESVRLKAANILAACLREASRFGGASVQLVPGVVNAKVSHEFATERSHLEITAMLPLLSQLPAKIAVENPASDFLTSPDEALRYIDDFKTPMVGWSLNIARVMQQRHGNHDTPEQWITALGPRLMHVRIGSGQHDDLLECGADGDDKGSKVDWAAVISKLDAVGYSTATPGRWITADARGGDAASLKKIAQQLKHMFVM